MRVQFKLMVNSQVPTPDSRARQELTAPNMAPNENQSISHGKSWDSHFFGGFDVGFPLLFFEQYSPYGFQPCSKHNGFLSNIKKNTLLFKKKINHHCYMFLTIQWFQPFLMTSRSKALHAWPQPRWCTLRILDPPSLCDALADQVRNVWGTWFQGNFYGIYAGCTWNLRKF